MTLREIADLVVRMAGENPQTPLVSCEQRPISFTTGPRVHPCCDGHLDERRRATHSATAEESQSQRVRRTVCSVDQKIDAVDARILADRQECLTRVILTASLRERRQLLGLHGHVHRRAVHLGP